SRTPAIVSGFVILVNAVASILLVRVLGFAGLALGTSIAALANATVLLWLLRSRLGGLDERRLMTTLAKVTLSAVVMAVAAFAIQRAMDSVMPGAALTARAVRLTISIGGALAALALTARLLGIDEFEDTVSMVIGRVQKLLRD